MALAPPAKPLSFEPGQFVFLAFGGPGGWERHPFSVSSAPSDPRVELTIKASGDYTRDLYDKLRPGVPAKLAGPFGGFDYRLGGSQIWIAGGLESRRSSAGSLARRGSTAMSTSTTPLPTRPTRCTSTRFTKRVICTIRFAFTSSALTQTAC